MTERDILERVVSDLANMTAKIAGEMKEDIVRFRLLEKGGDAGDETEADELPCTIVVGFGQQACSALKACVDAMDLIRGREKRDA